jgi:hypothetical protein
VLELEPELDDEEDEPPEVDDEELESPEPEPEEEEALSPLLPPPPSEFEESDDFEPLRRP